MIDVAALRRHADRLAELVEAGTGEADLGPALQQAERDGFDPLALRQVAREAGLEPEEREALIEDLERYRAVLGLFPPEPAPDPEEVARAAAEAEERRRRGGRPRKVAEAGTPDPWGVWPAWGDPLRSSVLP